MKPTFDGQLVYFFQKDDLGVNLYARPIDQSVNPTLVTEQNVSFFGGIAVDSDERRVTFHGYRPTEKKDQDSLLQYIKYNLVPTSSMDIFTASFDGFEPQFVKAVHGYSNFYPAFANTRGNKVVFSSNYGRNDSNFGLFLYNVFDFTVQPVTTLVGKVSTIHGVVSNDFNKIVFASNRNSTNPKEFQLFIADFNVTGSSSGLYDGGHYAEEQNSRSAKGEDLLLTF